MPKTNIDSNIVIRKDIVIYTAIKLYQNGTMFKMPTYLINEIVDNKRKLLLKHGGENIRYYTPDEIMKSLVSVMDKVYDGVFKKQAIKYNIADFKIK